MEKPLAKRGPDAIIENDRRDLPKFRGIWSVYVSLQIPVDHDWHTIFFLNDVIHFIRTLFG